MQILRSKSWNVISTHALVVAAQDSDRQGSLRVSGRENGEVVWRGKFKLSMKFNFEGAHFDGETHARV